MSTTHTVDRSLTATTTTTTWGARLVRGVGGGLIAGMVFGLMPQMVGMITSIAMIVAATRWCSAGSSHLVISAGFGFGFSLVVGTRLPTLRTSLVLGLGYGTAWSVRLRESDPGRHERIRHLNGPFVPIRMTLALETPVPLTGGTSGLLSGHQLAVRLPD